MQWTRDEVLSKAVKFRRYCSSASKQVHFNQVKPVLEPMRCNQAQVQSGATMCNQVLPGVIRCHQVQSGAIRCNQVQSGAIRCNQVQSGVIRFRCYQVQVQSGELAIRGHQVHSSSVHLKRAHSALHFTENHHFFPFSHWSNMSSSLSGNFPAQFLMPHSSHSLRNITDKERGKNKFLKKATFYSLEDLDSWAR